MTQTDKLGKLLTRKCGVTSLEIIHRCGSTTPTRRMSDMRDKGWTIKKTKANGKSHYIFHGTPPKK